MNKLVVAEHAVRELGALSKSEQDKIAHALRRLQEDPQAPLSFAVVRYDIRDATPIRVMPVGDMRIVFKVDPERRLIQVLSLFVSEEHK